MCDEIRHWDVSPVAAPCENSLTLFRFTFVGQKTFFFWCFFSRDSSVVMTLWVYRKFMRNCSIKLQIVASRLILSESRRVFRLKSHSADYLPEDDGEQESIRAPWNRSHPDHILSFSIKFLAFTCKQRKSRQNRNKRTEYHWESRMQANHMKCQISGRKTKVQDLVYVWKFY